MDCSYSAYEQSPQLFGVAFPTSSLAARGKRLETEKAATALPCRWGLNDPPTAVGGIARKSDAHPNSFPIPFALAAKLSVPCDDDRASHTGKRSAPG